MTVTLASLAHFNDYEPNSFGWPRGGPLVPLQVNGVNFGQCARDAHGLFVAFLTELAPHIPGGLKAGSCWSYAATDDLPDGSWSFHHYGTAVDVNWNVNHMGNYIADAHGQWAIPRSIATSLAVKYGLEWGGNWRGGFHDNMHFEIHLSPAVAADFRKYLPGKLPAVTRKAPFPLTGRDVFGPLAGPAYEHGGATAREQDYVRLIKQRLHALGFKHSDASNGEWGAGTTTDVRNWQAHTKQKVTGVLNATGWRLLMAS